MNNQISVFDQCRTTEAIQTQLQQLTQELLAVVQTSDPIPVVRRTPGIDEVIDLSMLSKLSYADLKACDQSGLVAV